MRVGRIGADAFLAILPHTDETRRRHLRRGGPGSAARAPDRRPARGEIAVSLSIGIALMRPGMTLTGEELLAAAEEALASPRAAGGNRIAFDRLHGLARLDERRGDAGATPSPTIQPARRVAEDTR